jgi:glycerol-3-phosphate dehydrogenase
MRKIDTSFSSSEGRIGTGGAQRPARISRRSWSRRVTFTHGTTGYYGLLHSGGRYAVKDLRAAKECIEENRILRRILPHCIEDTGGFFVLTPWDDPAYASRFVAGCQAAGIPVEEVPIQQMLREEPLLNPQIQQCFRVPDGAADSFLAADANAESARQHGATILNYHKVLSLLISGNEHSVGGRDGGERPAASRRVVGARLLDLVKDEEVEISADLVVNAAGMGRPDHCTGRNTGGDHLPARGPCAGGQPPDCQHCDQPL